ncbi:MAG: hypothetical protein M3P49_09335 [Actinomycetota bacterium]|nr:hypothetical protein [Actinomycetota bacterium]
MHHEPRANPQLTIWDEMGVPEPREGIVPSGWDYHWAQLIDPDAVTGERVAAIIYPHTRPSGGEE